jgi:hypothetical protein
MRRLVLHHRYSLPLAWDLSGYNNHGQVIECDEGSGVTQGSLGFHLAGSRIDVEQSDTLAHLGAFRCSVRFFLEGDTTARYNLAESELSFAFFVQAPLSLAATVLDADGNWSGAFSAPNTITPGQWHRADCGHDGISTSWCALDGQVIMTNTNVPGPVRPVGPRGLSIGHWPEPVDQYTFLGNISEVWLWQTRPDPVTDSCCAGDDVFARLSANARERGWTADSVQATLDQVHGVAAGVARQLPVDAQALLARLGLRLMLAIRAGDWSAAAHIIDDLVALLSRYVSQPDQQAALESILTIFQGQGYDHQLLALAAQAIFCAPPPPPDVKGDKRGTRGWPPPGQPPDDGPIPETPEGTKPNPPPPR